MAKDLLDGGSRGACRDMVLREAAPVDGAVKVDADLHHEGTVARDESSLRLRLRRAYWVQGSAPAQDLGSVLVAWSFSTPAVST